MRVYAIWPVSLANMRWRVGPGRTTGHEAGHTPSRARRSLNDAIGPQSQQTETSQTIQLIDSCPETGGRKMLCLNSPGDIFLNAPEGRVHIRSKFFSRETG